MEAITNKLEERIETMLNEASNLEAGSKERSAAIEDITKLVHVINEDEKNVNDFALKSDQMYQQSKDREQEVKEKKFDHWIKGIGLGLTAAQLLAVLRSLKQVLRFEETGSITSKAGGNLVGNIIRSLKL